MKTDSFRWTVLILAILLAVSPSVRSETPIALPAGQMLLSGPQLESLLAPIALYPDTLVAQILEAATHPVQIVEANRWVKEPANADLSADEVLKAVQTQPWDPSVKALVAFPTVLAMMDEDLDWTEALGQAFLAQQADVMDAVQNLRQRARAAGNLNSTAQQIVTADGQDIEIEPAVPDTIYVPYYEPTLVYGDWPWGAYPPFAFSFYPWWGFFAPAPFIVFNTFETFHSHHFHDHVDWKHHRINFDGRDRGINRGTRTIRPPIAFNRPNSVPSMGSNAARHFSNQGARSAQTLSWPRAANESNRRAVAPPVGNSHAAENRPPYPVNRNWQGSAPQSFRFTPGRENVRPQSEFRRPVQTFGMGNGLRSGASVSPPQRFSIPQRFEAASPRNFSASPNAGSGHRTHR